MAADSAPRIAAVGLATLDRLLTVDRYPAAGAYAIVGETRIAPGGTTANSAVCLARLGARVSVCALVGDDADGETMRAALIAEGIDTQWLTTDSDRPTDTATVIVSMHPSDRTIYCHQGARLARGDRLDVAAIFGHDLVLLDMDDLPLRRFLLDLPAHTLPATRLLGTLKDIAEAAPADGLELVLRHDAVVGNVRELIAITDCPNLDAAIVAVQRRMPGANLRAGFISLGPRGSIAFDRVERSESPAFPVSVVDTTGAGDAFAGAIAFGLARRWPLENMLRVANAVAAIATTALGAQTALPTWEAVVAFLRNARSCPPP